MRRVPRDERIRNRRTRCEPGLSGETREKRESEREEMKRSLTHIFPQETGEKNSQAPLFISFYALSLSLSLCSLRFSLSTEARGERSLRELAGSDSLPRLRRKQEGRGEARPRIARSQTLLSTRAMMLGSYYDEPLSPLGGPGSGGGYGGLDLPVRSFTTEYEDECVSVR